MSTISRALRYQILRRDNHTCRYCGATAPDTRITVDHVIPEALGGTTVPENLVAACEACNVGKAATPADAATVKNVAEDALRWRRAMEVANEMAARERADLDAYREAFLEHWQSWTYETGMYEQDEHGHQKWTTIRRAFDLPDDWRITVGALAAAELPLADLEEAITIALSHPRKDPYAYFNGVARNKLAARQAVAQELIRRGLVDDQT